MSLFKLVGTVTATGGGTIHPGGVLYDFIEITDDDGKLFNVKHAFVGGQAARGLGTGLRGEYLFDRVFVYGLVPGCICKQLYATKLDDGPAVYDTLSLRAVAVWRHIKLGLILLLFVFGLIFLAIAGLQILKALATLGRRRGLFYGGTPAKACEVRSREAVQM